MTQEEIIEMACQVFGGLIKKEERNNFVAFANLVAAKERERIIAANAPEIERCNAHIKMLEDELAAIKEALAQPEQEPVAFEEWLSKQHGDPEEIGFLQALRIAYISGQDSITTPPQLEQEPVAWIERDIQSDDFDPDSVTCEKPTIAADGWEWVGLYTAPPQRSESSGKPAAWVGLTDEDISEIVRGTHNTGSFVRAITAKLKEKNT